jgi:hypothetical protein
MIFHLYNSMGSHWAKMSKAIPGRTDNGIKNRFHNLRRQFEREDEHRLRLSSTNEFKDAIRLDRLRSFPAAMEGTSRRRCQPLSHFPVIFNSLFAQYQDEQASFGTCTPASVF